MGGHHLSLRTTRVHQDDYPRQAEKEEAPIGLSDFKKILQDHLGPMHSSIDGLTFQLQMLEWKAWRLLWRF